MQNATLTGGILHGGFELKRFEGSSSDFQWKLRASGGWPQRSETGGLESKANSPPRAEARVFVTAEAAQRGAQAASANVQKPNLSSPMINCKSATHKGGLFHGGHVLKRFEGR